MPTVSANDDAYRHLGVMSLEPLTETWNGATLVPNLRCTKNIYFCILHAYRCQVRIYQ